MACYLSVRRSGRTAAVALGALALPLLAHLDRSGRTVRLPDDSRRVRRTPSGSNPS